MKKSILIISLLLIAVRSHAIDFTDQGEYIGSSDCIACHERFYELWSTSHHGKAMEAFSVSLTKTMQPMKEPIEVGGETFIVEFDEHGGILRGTSPCGEETTWRIRFSFGGRNVRYFLIPMDKGKLQVAPVAYYVHQGKWYDSAGSMVRDFQDGGPEDVALHWTDRALTFNTSCHDCHVSQLEKNYNPEDDSYTTTWKEPGINCEVCHGPAEAHVKAAEEAAAKGEELTDLKLLTFHGDLNREQRDATCGPCHAKGQVLTRDFTPGELFFNHYDLTSYEDRDFWPDGRDLGENYTQTAWEANPCAMSGQLECIHCHTSSGRFRFKDNPNNSCLPCHEERVDDILAHSHHTAEAGVTCIDCHMPTTAQAFMSRSDHTFRPPSPEATLEFGSPNACNLCHNNPEAIMGNYAGHKKEDAEWADKYVKEWYGQDSGKSILEQGRIIELCREGDWDRLPEILAYLENPDCDPAATVAILRMLNNCPLPAKWPAIRAQQNSESEWVRATAAASLQYDNSAESTQGLLKACSDEFRTVRIRAAGALLARNLAGYTAEERAAYEAAHDEYWNSLIIWPDRWSSHYNQGIYFDRIGDPEKSLAAYEKSMELRNDVIQPLINASMVHARTGNSTNAYAMLEKALAIEPNNPMVNFNIALLDAEFGNNEAAEEHLKAALAAEPEMAQAAYNLGILLARRNNKEGFQWLETAALLIPENWTYTSSYLYFLDQDGRAEEAEPLLIRIIDTGRASPEAYFTLAGNMERAGRISEAMAIYKKAKLDPRLPMEAKRYASNQEQRLRSAL
ncbi:ammonia-forming cytochrome c nitrite reductase subunit c552 [Pontiellaceae bacterium B12219]|nr:ammonia-forming cytochrome c nitrite reductase subunit c552 [Pontiellaceae bacterium B12219]